MAKRLPSYPQLNENLILLSGWSVSPFRFYYETADHRLRALDLQHTLDDSSSFFLEDAAGEWNPETCHLYAETYANLENPEFLFGENGICCQNGIIGIGIQWFSRESRQRGSVEGMTVECLDSSVSERMSVHFEPGQIRGDLSLEIIFNVI